MVSDGWVAVGNEGITYGGPSFFCRKCLSDKTLWQIGGRKFVAKYCAIRSYVKFVKESQVGWWTTQWMDDTMDVSG